MASRFLKALAAVKLVELDETEQAKLDREPVDDAIDMDEIERMVAQEQVAQPPTATPPVVAPSPPPTGIDEGRPLEEIYLAEAVPDAAYSSEKLLKVLDGLKAMDPATRKAAVMAMDAADEEWSIADAVLDAQRKMAVLKRRAESVQTNLEAIKQNAAEEKLARDEYLTKATATIHQKIAELERTLQSEIETISSQKAEIDGRVQAAQLACRREVDRLHLEIQRLNQVPTTFAVHRPASE